MEQMNDAVDGLVGLVVCGFELAAGPVGRVGFVMEAAVGKRTTEALVEAQEQEGDVDAFCRQTVSVMAAIALEQMVPFEFAQVVAELVEPAGLRGELKRGEDRLVNLFGGPAADGAAVVQENLQQPDDPGVVDFDAGVAD